MDTGINDQQLDFENLSMTSFHLEKVESNCEPPILEGIQSKKEPLESKDFEGKEEDTWLDLPTAFDTEAGEFTFTDDTDLFNSERMSCEQKSQSIPSTEFSPLASQTDFKGLLCLSSRKESKNEERGGQEMIEQANTDWTAAVHRSLIQVAVRMVEENLLKISDFLGDFGQLERLFIANVLQIKSSSTVDWTGTNETFVSEVNSLLSSTKDKRKDDCLRFVYKRAIKFLLARCTDYKANKSHKMEDFSEEFILHYFGKIDESNEDVLDTSYASRKKIKKYCQLSSTFRSDFYDMALDHILQEYDAYRRDHYTKMLNYFSIEVQWGTSNDKILVNKFKRLPWRTSDLLMSVDMIKDLAK